MHMEPYEIMIGLSILNHDFYVCTAISSYTVLQSTINVQPKQRSHRVDLFSFTLAVFPGSCCNILLKQTKTKLGKHKNLK